MRTDANQAMAVTMVDEWVRCGLRHAFVAPGSRSTPLALALWNHPGVAVQVVLDERSAGFMALGASRASGRPVVVATTSGTAVANIHPAVMEAHHGRVGLVVATADRPRELRDTGANQATDQHRVYGSALRWFAEVDGLEGADPSMAERTWRSVACRTVAEAWGRPAGPVQVNLAFREPLVPAGPLRRAAEPRGGGRPWTAPPARPTEAAPAEVEAVVDLVRRHRRGGVAVGWGSGVSAPALERFALAAGWPVLADAVSGLRGGPTSVSTYDALLRDPEWAREAAPDAVVQLGAALTGRVGSSWAASAPARVVVDPDRLWSDPDRSATAVLGADGDAILVAAAQALEGWAPPTASWLARWLDAELSARTALDGFLDELDGSGTTGVFEGRVARDLFRTAAGSVLAVGSSMAVRDCESFAANAGAGSLAVAANRGLSGIDGFTSTALGTAIGTGGPVTALMGDLTFLHDVNGLNGGAGRGVDAVLVVLDNGGGAIFSFLPQAEAVGLATFEALFATPHGLDLVAVARAHGVAATRVVSHEELAEAVAGARRSGGVSVVAVTTPDRATNVELHRQAWAAVAGAVR